MTWLNRIERRFARLAIPHLTLLVVIGQGLLYVLSLAPQDVALSRVQLDPARVLDGEVWRVITFPFAPPSMLPIFAIFYFSLLYTFGSALERHWGVLRYNLFLLSGYIANVAAAFAALAIMRATAPELAADAGEAASTVASNGFLYSSIFLAFARLYPDFTMMLFFVLPVKIKWLALVQCAAYFFILATGPWMAQMLVLASVLNYLLFFGKEHWQQAKFNHRRQEFKLTARTTLKPLTHTCRVCQVSSVDSPRMMFRYCSKCAGQVCYCPEHIRDHEHLAATEAAAT